MATWKTRYGWRARVQHQGETITAPGCFKYKAEAQRWVRDTKAKLKERVNTFALLSLVDSYLDQVKLDKSLKTYQEKVGSLKRLYNHVGDIDPRDVTPVHIADLINQRAKDVSRNAANKDRKNIKTFFRWLTEFHNILHDPTAPIRPKPHERKARRLIPLEDIYKVIMAAPWPEQAMMECYWHTGARRGEILRLTWEHVNLEQGWIRLGTRKTRTGEMSYQRLPVNNDLRAVLERLWRDRDKSTPYLFPAYYLPDENGNNSTGEQRAHRLLVGIYKVDRKTGKSYRKGGLCQKAGVEPFGFHDIRHTVATYLNDVGKVPLKNVHASCGTATRPLPKYIPKELIPTWPPRWPALSGER
jgi:integrase